MKRGEIWTVAGGANYAGKPRPAAIIQDDAYEGIDSITICPFTTDAAETPITRPAIAATESNGLREPSLLMVDKITTLSRSKLGRCIGRLSNEDIAKLNRAMVLVLGLASTRTS